MAKIFDPSAQLKSMLRKVQAERKQHDRIVARFRKTHPRFDELQRLMMDLLRIGQVEGTGAFKVDLEKAYTEAARRAPK